MRSPRAFSLDGSGSRVAEICIIEFPEQSVTHVPTRCITNVSMLHSQEVCQTANLQFDKPNTLPEAFNAWQFIIDVTGRRATFAIPYAKGNWKVCLLAAGVPGKESATLCISAAMREEAESGLPITVVTKCISKTRLERSDKAVLLFVLARGSHDVLLKELLISSASSGQSTCLSDEVSRFLRSPFEGVEVNVDTSESRYKAGVPLKIVHEAME
jgi:hypothetical protein